MVGILGARKLLRGSLDVQCLEDLLSVPTRIRSPWEQKRRIGKAKSLLNHPLWPVVGSLFALRPKPTHTAMRVQTDVLDGGPDNRQATRFRGEYINLIGALPHIALRGFRWHWWSE